MIRNLLQDHDTIRNYLLGGHGTFTLQNTKTGSHLTFKISVPEDAEAPDLPHFVAVLTGSDNTSDYQYLGLFRNKDNQLTYSHGHKSKIGRDAVSAKTAEWFFRHLNDQSLPPALEVYHEGTCCRCGRKLTTPESIEAGIGPVCAEK